jgi:hypothetical protein
LLHSELSFSYMYSAPGISGEEADSRDNGSPW